MRDSIVLLSIPPWPSTGRAAAETSSTKIATSACGNTLLHSNFHGPRYYSYDEATTCQNRLSNETETEKLRKKKWRTQWRTTSSRGIFLRRVAPKKWRTTFLWIEILRSFYIKITNLFGKTYNFDALNILGSKMAYLHRSCFQPRRVRERLAAI